MSNLRLRDPTRKIFLTRSPWVGWCGARTAMSNFRSPVPKFHQQTPDIRPEKFFRPDPRGQKLGGSDPTKNRFLTRILFFFSGLHTRPRPPGSAPASAWTLPDVSARHCFLFGQNPTHQWLVHWSPEVSVSQARRRKLHIDRTPRCLEAGPAGAAPPCAQGAPWPAPWGARPAWPKRSTFPSSRLCA